MKYATDSFQMNGSTGRANTLDITLWKTFSKHVTSPHNLPKITQIPHFWIQSLKVLITSTFLIMGRLKFLWPQFFERLTLGPRQ